MFPFGSDNGSLFFIIITTGVLIRVACKNNSRRHSSQNREITKERTELSETLNVIIIYTYNFWPQPSLVSSEVLLTQAVAVFSNCGWDIKLVQASKDTWSVLPCCSDNDVAWPGTGTLRVHSTHLARMDSAMLVLTFILAKENRAFCLAMLIFLKLIQPIKTVTKNWQWLILNHFYLSVVTAWNLRHHSTNRMYVFRTVWRSIGHWVLAGMLPFSAVQAQIVKPAVWR